jgi:hypothetical protein
LMCGVPPEDGLFVELSHVATQSFEQAPSFGRNTKSLTSLRVGWFSGAAEPTVSLHPGQGGIEGSRTQPMAVLGELLDQPRTPDLTRERVVKDVDLPESKSNLAVSRRKH